MTTMQLKALAAHDVLDLTDAEAGLRFGVSRTAIAARRRRALASLSPGEQQRYFDRFPPRAGRPRKRRIKDPSVFGSPRQI